MKLKEIQSLVTYSGEEKFPPFHTSSVANDTHQYYSVLNRLISHALDFLIIRNPAILTQAHACGVKMAVLGRPCQLKAFERVNKAACRGAGRTMVCVPLTVVRRNDILGAAIGPSSAVLFFDLPTCRPWFQCLHARQAQGCLSVGHQTAHGCHGDFGATAAVT
jgi:hypothetical protein